MNKIYSIVYRNVQENCCRVCHVWNVCEIDLPDKLPEAVLGDARTYMDCYCTVVQLTPEVIENNNSKLCVKCGQNLLSAYKFIFQAKKAERNYQKQEQLVDSSSEKEISNDHNNALDECLIENDGEEEDCIFAIEIDQPMCLEESVDCERESSERSFSPPPDNYICKLCNKNFKQKRYLLRHMKYHKKTDETFPCDQCDKVYKLRNSLVTHMRLHNGIGLQQCEFCEKKFSCNRELIVHKRFHTGDFPYVCDVCGQKFAVITHLKDHVLRHKNMKVECQECGKLFTAPKSLYEHFYVHIGQMPYPCCYCDRGYPSVHKFKNHMLKTHKIKPTAEEVQKSKNKAPINNVEKPVIKWVQVQVAEKQ